MNLLASFVCVCVLQCAVYARSQYAVSNSSSYGVIIFKEESKEFEDVNSANISALIQEILPTLDAIFKKGTPLKLEGDKNDNSKNKDNHATTITETIINSVKKEDTKNSNEKDKTNTTVFNKYGDKSDTISSKRCTDSNEHYPISGSCDGYIRCQNGKEEVKICPDGLRYNPDVNSAEYPCQYPFNVNCPPGSTLQPPQPNDVCPNKYGYFKTNDRFNCSSYRICENGTGYDYSCPSGLAFSSSSYRCEFPDTVPECKAEAYLGFRCPETQSSKNVDIPRKYGSSTDCNIYYSCINNKPRLLKCDEFFGFDFITQSCVPAFKASCSEEQKRKAYTALTRDANGKYIVRDFNDSYYQNRNVNLSFKSQVKNVPKVI